MKDMREEAKKFTEFWTFQRGSEKGEAQSFWNSLLRDVLGVEKPEEFIKYEVPIIAGDGTTKFLDGWIPSTRVLIEHKSRGRLIKRRVREEKLSVAIFAKLLRNFRRIKSGRHRFCGLSFSLLSAPNPRASSL